MRLDDAAGVQAMVERLVAVGDRSCGSAGSADAATELERALRGLGLEVREEPFRFLRMQLVSSALVSNGASVPHLVLSYGGAGSLLARGMDCGDGSPEALANAGGAIALVRRDPILHRQAQYQACVVAGAAAMILLCDAPEDRPQNGTVREAWEGPGPIPALAVGERTGALLLERAGAPLELAVEASYRLATGRNLVARVDGSGAWRGIEVGAHHDAWGPGAVDNASGCAALLACAVHLTRARPASPVELVAFDGEEVGLLGAWHRVRRRAPGPGALIDLEMPSSLDAVIRALAVGSAPACAAAAESGLAACYEVSGPLASVPELMGGYIPADVWPYYLAGLGGLCTVCDTPHYHTAGDRPEGVDAVALARVGEATAAAARSLAAAGPEFLVGRDVPAVQLAARRTGGLVEIEASLRWEEGGRAVDDRPVELLVFADDFRLVARVGAQRGVDGSYQASAPIPETITGPLDVTVRRIAGSESAEAHVRFQGRPAGAPPRRRRSG